MASPKLPPVKTVTYTDGDQQPLAEWWDEQCNHGFLRIPNILLRSSLGIDPHAKVVLLTLMSWTANTDPGKEVTRLGEPIRLRHLAEWTGLSPWVVSRMLTKLEEARFITRVGVPGEPNRYRIDHVAVMNAAYRGIEG